MATLGKEWIWPDITGVPAALTAGYVAGLEFQVMAEPWIACIATLPAGGVPDPGLCVRVDVSFDGGTTWYNGYDEFAVPGFVAGDQGFFIKCPPHCTARISLRDILADPDTTCQVYAHARAIEIEDHNRYDPPELSHVQHNGVAVWSDGANPPAAAALGAGALAYGPVAGTHWIPVGRANVGQIWLTTTGGPTTSVEVRVEESLNYGGAYAPLSFVNTVIAGVANIMPNMIQFQSAAGTLANGTYQSQRFAVNPNSWIRVSAQRTGAAVNAIAYIRLFREET